MATGTQELFNGKAFNWHLAFSLYQVHVVFYFVGIFPT